MIRVITLGTRLRSLPLLVASLLLCVAPATLAAPQAPEAFLQLPPMVGHSSSDLGQKPCTDNVPTECRGLGIGGSYHDWTRVEHQADPTAAEEVSEPGPMVYDGAVVDDDGFEGDGNDNGVLGCGESIELWVALYNEGAWTATGVRALIATSDPYITFTHNTESDYPDVPALASRTNVDDFDFQVAHNAPNGHVIHFDLHITASNGGPWWVSFDLPLTCSCVYPATCHVDQASSDEPNGTEPDPFIKFTEGMEISRVKGSWHGVEAEVIVSPGQYAGTGIYTYPTTISAPEGKAVIGAFPAMQGDTSCAWGSEDCNRCVPDVVDAFNRLRSHGDILGFRMRDEPPPHWGLSSKFAKHWQGLTRVAAGQGRVLIASQDDLVIDGAGWSGFVVADFGSRDPTGRRFRSNRLDPSLPFEFTPPPSADGAITTTLLHPTHEHPGSPQAVGELMVIGAGREVYMYDLSDPTRPQRLGPPDAGAVGGIGPILDRPGRSASSAAMAKLADGRYLIVVASSDAQPLDFYVSHEPGDVLTYSNFDRWYPLELVPMADQRFGWDPFQAVNLVTECETGKLYLVATCNLDSTSSTWIDGQCFGGVPCYPDGEDWAGLYEIGMADDDDIELTKVAEFHAYCSYAPWEQPPACDDDDNACLSSEHHCNFDAAAGLYVDPAGHLILYSSEHDNDGPTALGESEGSVKMMEFREMPHGPCDTIEDAWVELFEHDHFAGRGRMIDYQDRALENYADYDQVGLEYFDEQASSARWCIPEGWGYRLYEDPGYGGDTLLIVGIGVYRELADLNDYSFGDRTSSSVWVDLSSRASSMGSEVTIE